MRIIYRFQHETKKFKGALSVFANIGKDLTTTKMKISTEAELYRINSCKPILDLTVTVK